MAAQHHPASRHDLGRSGRLYGRRAGSGSPGFRSRSTYRVYLSPRASPDGTRIAVDFEEGGSSDIWIWHLERETLTQFTFSDARDDVPLWTPDSERIVFRSSRDGGGVFWKAADGTGQVERLMDEAARAYSWSPDRRLIFDQGGDIGVVSLDGEHAVEMLLAAEFDEVEPALSPNGRWLAYTSGESEQAEIYVRPFPNADEGLWRVSRDGGVHPVWSADGRELFYQGQTDFMVAHVETASTYTTREGESD